MLISIDPGVKDTALASWQGQYLDECAIFANDSVAALRENVGIFTGGRRVASVALEGQWFQGPAPAQDIAAITLWGGIAVGLLSPNAFEVIAPAIWKGSGGRGKNSSERKAYFCHRIFKTLLSPEVERLEHAFEGSVSDHIESMSRGKIRGKGGKRLSDLLDAIGIGLWVNERI